MSRSGQQSRARQDGNGSRWELTDSERDRIAAEGRYSAGDVMRALLSRPSLIPSVVRRSLSGAGQGLREDPELGWYLYTRRLQKHFPDAATGAGWYGEEAFVSALDPYLDPSARVIEMGCGAGRLMRLIAPKVAEMVGCDLSKPMLEEAERNLSQYDNVSLLLTDAAGVSEVGYSDFDVAFAHDLLVNFDLDPALAMLDVMHDLLRPGGVCVVSFLTVDEDAWGREHMEVIRGAPRGGRVGVGHPRPYVTSQVDTMMRMAGFELVSAAFGEAGSDRSRPHYIVAGKVSA